MKVYDQEREKVDKRVNCESNHDDTETVPAAAKVTVVTTAMIPTTDAGQRKT